MTLANVLDMQPENNSAHIFVSLLDIQAATNHSPPKAQAFLHPESQPAHTGNIRIQSEPISAR